MSGLVSGAAHVPFGCSHARGRMVSAEARVAEFGPKRADVCKCVAESYQLGSFGKTLCELAEHGPVFCSIWPDIRTVG